MTTPQRPDRWDGWDDPDYEPTQDELEEPIVIDAPSAEALGAALIRHKPRRA